MAENNSSENSSTDSSSEHHSERHHSEDNKFYINLETLNEESLKIYPERRGGIREKGFYENLFGNRDISSKLRCERHVRNIVAKSKSFYHIFVIINGLFFRSIDQVIIVCNEKSWMVSQVILLLYLLIYLLIY